MWAKRVAVQLYSYTPTRVAPAQTSADEPGFRGFGGQGMVLSPQRTINHTPPPSQHVQHLQPTHTPLPIEVGTLQHPHPKAVSTVTTYIRKFGQMNPLQAQALPACLLPLSFSLGTCVCMPLRGALQRPPARWRPLGEPRRVRRVRPRGRRREAQRRRGQRGGRHHTHPPSEDVRRRRSTHTLPPFLTG